VALGFAPHVDGSARVLQRVFSEAEIEAIDADLRQMGADEEYQAEVDRIGAEFAKADWEALQAAEAEPHSW